MILKVVYVDLFVYSIYMYAFIYIYMCVPIYIKKDLLISGVIK